MSCRRRREARPAVTPSLRAQLGDFEVAITGGIWVAAGGYRLLTEAEWEYAARAGTTTAFSTGAIINKTQANYIDRSFYSANAYQNQTAPVGSYSPNAFGLYDVHGNVWEWTEDCWNENYNGSPSDGVAWTSGDCSQRVLRGGGWISTYQEYLRSAYRVSNTTSIQSYSNGFRVARTD